MEPQNIEKLADAMSLLIQDEQKRKSMGKAAAEFVKNKYDPQDLANRISEIYESLLK